jgi:GT2 family glycosyltransferase
MCRKPKLTWHSMHEISIIIVSWNAQSYLRDCLASVRETGGPLVREVIVVDNASSDGSSTMVAEEFPEVVLIRSNENLGFARANNLGMTHASGTLFALINSDVIVHPECLQRLATFLDQHHEVALAGPKVFGRDNRVQISCGRLPGVWNTVCEFLLLYKIFPRWPLFSGFQMKPWEVERQTDVEVLSGCFCLARRAAVDEVGVFDEQFFFYAEDVDWCKRFRDAGWKIALVPDATTTHFGGGSSSNASRRYSIEILRANLIYWRKHHGNLGQAEYYLLAMIQHSLRFAVRWILRFTGLVNRDETEQKLEEHFICLRWLLTGKGI